MPIQTVNPLTNKVVKSFEEMTDAAVDSAVVQAVKTFTDWKKPLMCLSGARKHLATDENYLKWASANLSIKN